jgi:hypothetical protein
MPFDRNDKRLRFVGLDQIAAPPTGSAVLHFRNEWWAVCPKRGLIFYRQAPICNVNEDVARQVIPNLYPWAEIRLIPEAFVRISATKYDIA